MSDEFEFGPKMRSLTERQRTFVMVLVEFPALTGAEAARQAGYSDSSDGAKVRACNLLQDRKIVDAIQEQAGKRLWATSLKAAARMDQLIDSDDEAVALKAAAAVLDRSGLAPLQQISINQTVTDRTGMGMLERIKALAAQHGLDPAKLLGVNTAPVVDAEFSEVEPSGE